MSPAPAVSRRSLFVTACSVALSTVAVIPVSRYQLGSSVSFVPGMLAVVACFDLLSVYLLIGDYYDRGDLRLLMMSWAYSWSLPVMAGYALAFPGAIAVRPPLALTPSLAPYLYVAWHGGFPTLLGAAWAPWPERWITASPVSRRHVISLVSVVLAFVGGAVIVALFALFAHRLPVLIQGLDTSRMTVVTAPIVVPLVVLALGMGLHGTRRRIGPEMWSIVAILACLCDLTLTYFSGTRYSIGWYCGRSLTLVSSAAVLIAILTAFRRLKAQAEHNATVDPLTGLCNRRSLNAALDQLFARCRRSGAPLGVLSLDLDRFKQVNDRYGHATGDEILVELGRLLTRSCRKGDVVARVGGEEFLLLLPDTDERGTLIVAEKLRVLVTSMTVPVIMTSGMTASFGASALCKDDLDTTTLLRRADGALYEAKKTGRNRVVMSGASMEFQFC